MTVAGSRTLSLGAANQYGGTTTVQGGTLAIAAAGALPSGSKVSNNGTLRVSANTVSFRQA